MEKLGLELWKLFINQAELWPGWDHAKTPIAFHDQDRAVLFGHSNPTTEFIKKEGEGIIFHTACPKPVSFTANSSVELNGEPTATIMWHPREEEAMLALISHEAFHAYQMATGCPFGQISAAMKYPVNNPEVQALAETEGQLLYNALQHKESLNHVESALDARAARQKLLSTEVATFENEVELGEGLATYVEIRCAGHNSTPWNSKIQSLQKLNKKAWGADRLRFYYSGMAWALLCDKYAENWQTRGWRTLAKIVAEAINYKPDPVNRNFPGLDFPAIFSRHEKEAEEREKDIRKTLARALPGTGLRVEVHTRGNPVGGGWNPNTAVTFPGIGRFHPTGLMYIFDTGSELKIERNCIEKENCRHIVFEQGDLSVRMNGKTITEGTHRGSLSICGDGCRVKISRARADYHSGLLIAEEINN